MDADAHIGRCRHGRLADGCTKCEDSAELKRTSKTTTERVETFRARQRAARLKEVRNLWAHPEDHAAIKALAQRLRDKRLTRIGRFGVCNEKLKGVGI